MNTEMSFPTVIFQEITARNDLSSIHNNFLSIHARNDILPFGLLYYPIIKEMNENKIINRSKKCIER